MTAPCIRPFSIAYNTRDILGSYSSAKSAAKGRDRQLYIVGRETETGNPLDRLIAYRKERQIAPGFQEAQIERLAGDNFNEKQFRQQSLALMQEQISGVRDMSRKLEERTSHRLPVNPAITSAERAGRVTLGSLPETPLLDLMAQARQARRSREQAGGAIPGGWRSELGIPAEIGALEAPEYLMGMGSFIGSGGGEAPSTFAQPISLEPNDPYLGGMFTTLSSPLAQLQPNAEIGDLRGRSIDLTVPSIQQSGTLQLAPEAPVVRGRGRPRRAVAPMSEVEAEMEQRRSEGGEGGEGGEEQPRSRGRPKGSRRSVEGGQGGQSDIRTFVLDEEQLAELYSSGGLSASGAQSASGDPGYSDIRAIRDSNLSDEEKVKRALQARPLTMDEMATPDMNLDMMDEYGSYLLRYPDGTFKKFLKIRKQDVSQASRAPGGGRVGGGFGGLH
jgi:hypothetical protein